MPLALADLESLLSSIPKPADAPISELIADCIAQCRMIGKVKYAKTVEADWRMHLGPFWDGLKASDITTSRQREYHQKRLLEGAARATINREVAALSKALRLGYDHEPKKISAIPKLIYFPLNNARLVFVSNEQLAAIRKVLETRAWPWFRVFVELLYWLGWRCGELKGLRARNVDLVERCIRLDKTKNGDPREVPLTPALVALVKPIVEGLPPDAKIFPSEYSNILRMWNRVKAAAGCPELHIHDFRRTSARSKRAAGVPTSVIMEIQGWKTEAMFRRYAIVSREDKLAALKKLERVK